MIEVSGEPMGVWWPEMYGKCTASDPSLITAERTRDDGEGNKTIRERIETRDESARALICRSLGAATLFHQMV